MIANNYPGSDKTFRKRPPFDKIRGRYALEKKWLIKIIIQKNQRLTNSFIAEFTQKTTSKSGKASATCKKKESVIRDNTLEEIPRDMPKYDSLQ